MRRLGLALSLFLSTLSSTAAEYEALSLSAEYPVAGMPSGNLSGLAMCDGTLQAVSDRDDDRLYHLRAEDGVMQAQAERFSPPAAPKDVQPWGIRVRNAAAAMIRGGQYDFEGLSCDAHGNRYLVSETHAAVLKVPANHQAQWLNLPNTLVRQARASGLLLNFNQGFEGIAVDPTGSRLWLAAEQRRRGLVVVHKQGTSWRCLGGCVLLAESGIVPTPTAIGGYLSEQDFAGLAFYNGKLFTLERQAHVICRRAPQHGQIEQCWSYADAAFSGERSYPAGFGMAEALWIDAKGAWVGVDNGDYTRADGEQRPIVWRFNAPAGGWDARP